MDPAPGPHEEPFEPRPHDHLVEPVFGGLGIDRPPRRTESESGGAREPARTRRSGGCLAPAVLLGTALLLAL